MGSVKKGNIALRTLIESIEIPSSAQFKSMMSQKSNNNVASTVLDAEHHNNALQYRVRKHMEIKEKKSIQIFVYPTLESHPASTFLAEKDARTPRDRFSKGIIQCRIPVLVSEPPNKAQFAKFLNKQKKTLYKKSHPRLYSHEMEERRHFLNFSTKHRSTQSTDD